MNIVDAFREDFWEVRDLLKTSEGRRVLTEHDPLLFAYIYFPHHLQSPVDGSMTLCDFHLDLIEFAKSWSKPIGKAKEHRSCFIAPRMSGKSTWTFLLMPMWVGAHGHRKFVAAFSDAGSQAETHLQTFKMELMNNDLLRQDFPEFCESMKVPNTSKELMNNRNQIMQANGFIFMARGADSNALGLKLGAQRPDVLLFDDIEPTESNYSDHEAKKRKDTLISGLFALNTWAVVAIVGTTTMPNSLIDQMRKVEEARRGYDGDPDLFGESVEPDFRWVIDENIKVHYWPAIMSEGDEERSLWPETWSMEFLNRERHTRAFQKNMMNRPVSADGGYWEDDDIEIDSLDSYRRTIICVDPAVTTNKRSDYTGIAVVSAGADGRIYVRHAEQVKLEFQALADHVASVVEEFNPSVLVIETNQGGDLWRGVFKDLPVKYKGIRAKDSKEIRASKVVDIYRRGRVRHTAHFHIAEEQMLAFPHVTHDDVVDAIVTGVSALTTRPRGMRVRQTNYLED